MLKEEEFQEKLVIQEDDKPNGWKKTWFIKM
jgi:hypothetical protein